MALTPEYYNLNDIAAQTENEEMIRPQKTWFIDFENNRITHKIDGEQALRQFIYKALITQRNRYMVYSEKYGCELSELIGGNIDYDLMDVEIPRMIKEALIYDDRIENVEVDFTRDGDKLFINVTVTPVSGTAITEGVEFNV